MPNPLLPRTIPVRLAAVIVGRSERGFVRDVLPAVEADRGRVSVAALERHLTREIDPEEFLRADRRLDTRREQQRQNKSPHRRQRIHGGDDGQRSTCSD